MLHPGPQLVATVLSMFSQLGSCILAASLNVCECLGFVKQLDGIMAVRILSSICPACVQHTSTICPACVHNSPLGCFSGMAASTSTLPTVIARTHCIGIGWNRVHQGPAILDISACDSAFTMESCKNRKHGFTGLPI